MVYAFALEIKGNSKNYLILDVLAYTFLVIDKLQIQLFEEYRIV